jgi:hypothetical protein
MLCLVGIMRLLGVVRELTLCWRRFGPHPGGTRFSRFTPLRVSGIKVIRDTRRLDLSPHRIHRGDPLVEGSN